MPSDRAMALDAKVVVVAADSGITRDAEARRRHDDVEVPAASGGIERDAPTVEQGGEAVAENDPDARPVPMPGPDLDGGAARFDAGAAEAGRPATDRVCMQPLAACDAGCSDTHDDPQNCGGCGVRCAAPRSACDRGECVRPAPAGCMHAARPGRSYLFCSATRTWEDARRSCLGFEMDLAVVDDAAENEFIRSFGVPAWVGASDNEFDGRWSLVTFGDEQRFAGPPLEYANWARGQPDGTWRCSGRTVAQRCVDGVLHREACARVAPDGSWSDAACVQDLAAYVCEEYQRRRR